MDIDTLWQLGDAHHRTPQWCSYYMPDLDEDSDSDSDGPPDLSSASRKGDRKGRKLLAITNGTAEDSDGSMPELQSVSNSSEEGSEDSESGSGDDGEDDDESGYDTEQEDELRDLLREAMDTAVEADFFDSSNVSPEINPFAEERKGNPFLKLLGSLRGVFITLESFWINQM